MAELPPTPGAGTSAGLPTVSVVIPAYNAAHFLDDALDSVGWQTVTPIDVIVVDDGSTDCTAAQASARAWVTCVRQPHSGVAAARNRGIATARGECIALLDADDIWLPGCLEAQLRALAAQPEAAYATGFHRPFLDDPEQEIPDWMRPGSYEAVNIYPLPSAWMVRRQAFDRVGGFDHAHQVAEDFEWLIRARLEGLTAAAVEEVVMLRRLHRSNLTHQTLALRDAGFRALRGALETRRARGGAGAGT